MRPGTAGSRSTALRYALLLVVPAALVGAAAGWALAAPDPVQAEAPVRTLADGLGATVLGLAALPRLHDRMRPAWRLLAVFGGLWAVAEFVLLATEAAEVVGVPLTRLRAGDFGDYLAHVSGGQIGIAVLIGTAAVVGYSTLAFRRPDRAAADLVLVFAAVTLVLRRSPAICRSRRWARYWPQSTPSPRLPGSACCWRWPWSCAPAGSGR